MGVAIALELASEMWAEGTCVTSSWKAFRAKVYNFTSSLLPTVVNGDTPGHGGFVSCGPRVRNMRQYSTFVLLATEILGLLHSWLIHKLHIFFHLSFTLSIGGSHHYSYLSLWKLNSQRLSKFPKVTQLLSGRTKIQIQFWLFPWSELLSVGLSNFSVPYWTGGSSHGQKHALRASRASFKTREPLKSSQKQVTHQWLWEKIIEMVGIIFFCQHIQWIKY